MSESTDTQEELAARLAQLEHQMDRVRRAVAVLARDVGGRTVDEVIAEYADRPLGEGEMEEAFARLDSALGRSGLARHT